MLCISSMKVFLVSHHQFASRCAPCIACFIVGYSRQTFLAEIMAYYMVFDKYWSYERTLRPYRFITSLHGTGLRRHIASTPHCMRSFGEPRIKVIMHARFLRFEVPRG